MEGEANSGCGEVGLWWTVGGWWGKGRKNSTERDERGSKSHVTFRPARTIGEMRRTCATRPHTGCTGHPAALYIPGGRGNVVPIIPRLIYCGMTYYIHLNSYKIRFFCLLILLNSLMYELNTNRVFKKSMDCPWTVDSLFTYLFMY